MSADTYTEESALPHRMLKIIDVSAIQGAIDWKAVAGDGIVGAYLKCTEGMNFADPRFLSNFTAARQAGITTGAYHFGKPKTAPGMTTEQDAAAEAKRFYEKSGGLGSAKGEMPPVLDIEVMDGMAPSVVASWIRVWLAEAEQLFQAVPVIYTGAPMANALKLVPTATRHPLWVARYIQNYGAPAMTWEAAHAHPGPLDVPFMQALPWRPDAWTLWQFSGGMANLPGNRVAGIACDVDCNRFNGGEDVWTAFCGG